MRLVFLIAATAALLAALPVFIDWAATDICNDSDAEFCR